jgi:hypothetical protein
MKGTSAIQTLSNVGSVNLALTDHPLIIEVSPNAVTPPPPPPPPPVTSPNDTVVLAGSTAGITDASGNVWTITGGGPVAVNGTVDAITSGVVKLAYVNGTIWQQTASGLWWGETQPNDSWGPQAGTMTGPLPVTASPNNTVVVANSTAGITDASGNVWTITSGSQVAVNGVVDAITSGVVELAYVNGKIWQQTSGKLWWGETQPNDAWASQAGTATSPLPLTWPVVGAGSDTLVLKVSEDTYLGDAQFTVSVDGKQLGGTLTASASHAAGAAGTFTVKGDWAVGNHTVAVQFLNDAYGGTAATDRNLYVTGATYDGASTGASLTLMSAGAQSFSVKDTTPIVVNVPSTQASTTIAVSNATINASGGNHIFFISGHGDTFNLGGGVETITDSGSGGNIFNLPATGSGSAVFNAAVLTDGDVFGLKAALAATQWTGTSNTLGSFLHTLQSGANTQLLVSAAPTSAATGTLLATFNSSNLSLSTILAHSLTT